MKVAAVMTQDPYSVHPEDGLDTAMHLMDRRGIRHLPVVEEEKLVGVFSDRALLDATGWLVEKAREPGPDGRPRTVRDIMSTDVRTVDPQAPLSSISVDLLMDRVGCLPVVEADHLVGIISEADLLRTYLAAVLDGRLTAANDPAVVQRMATRLVTIGPATSVDEALRACHMHRFRHLPVVEGERLVGIVSDRDLRRLRSRRQEAALLFEEVATRHTWTIAPDAPLSRAAALMLEHEISALPVLDAPSRMVGLVTATDLVDHCIDTLWNL